MRKPTLLIILALAGFSAFQVILHLSGGPEEIEWNLGIGTVTNEDFDQVIGEGPSWTLVKVWAPWCDVCKRMRPIYNQVADDFGDDIAFLRLDSEAEPEWADTYRVNDLPTLILFYEGQEISRSSRYMPLEAVRNWIAHTTGLLPLDQ